MALSHHLTTDRLIYRLTRRAAAASFALLLTQCSFPEYGGFSDEAPDAHAIDANSRDVSHADGGHDAMDATSHDDASDAHEGGADAPDVSVTDAKEEPEGGGADVTSDTTDASQDTTEDAPDDVIDAGQDTGPTLPLLNVWHIASNMEPPSVTMRNPRFPTAGTDKQYFYLGEYRPEGKVKSATLYWQWTSALAVESPVHEQAFAWDSKNGNNDYWVTSVPWPKHAVGSFTYYIRVTPEDAATYATTFLYGTDTKSSKTRFEATAKASPYHPEVRGPAVGEVVITEVMVNPLGGQESPKEWFEVYNAAPEPISLDTCWIADNSDAHLTQIAAPWFVLWPGSYATLGGSLSIVNMGGFTPDYGYNGTMPLNNSKPFDAVRLFLPDKTTIADVVDFSTWSASTCCNSDGRSMQLNMDAPTATSNDSQASWCKSTKPYGTSGTSFGTPNAPTDHCP